MTVERTPNPGQPQPFRLADYYLQTFLRQPAVSPDGSRVAFVVERFRRKTDERYRNLWVVRTDGSAPPHRLTRGTTADSVPAWSPDGRYLAFLSTRPHEIEVDEALEDPGDRKDGESGREPRPQVWILDMQEGGEPRQLTARPEGVSAFAWSPDGRRIVIAARDPTPQQAKYLEAIRGKRRGPLVLDRVQHKHDEYGYLDEVRTHLFVVDVDTRAEHRLTDGPCDETQPVWSPTGEWIAFVSNRTGDADNNARSDLWLIRPDGSECRRLTFGDVAASVPRFSPDGRRVAFLSSLEPENVYALRHVLCVDVADAEPVPDLASCVGVGWSEIGGIVPDTFTGDPIENARRYPVPVRRTNARVLTAGLDRPAEGPPVWTDDATVLVLVGDRGQTRVARLGIDAQPVIVFPADDRGCTVDAFHAAGGTAVVGIDRPETAMELFALPAAVLASGEPVPVGEARRLTHLQAALFAGRTPARYVRVTYRNRAGQEVEALVALPPGFNPDAPPADPRERPPLLVAIHGGPMSYDSPHFRFDRQYWAGQGYVVLMVNYRGSTSYGEAFCRAIRSRWGPMEHEDVMCGVDHLIERGWVDPDRLFITGFSYGGIMTNWAVGHTDRFRAAASEHGMWDYVSAFGTDDCHLWWQDDLGVPWQNEALYRAVSPMSAVDRIRTPMLITAGEVDWRCPLSNSEQLYLALKKRGVPARLVIYQGERHAIDRPRRGIDRIRRISAWFAAHGGLPLQDDSAEGYPDP